MWRKAPEAEPSPQSYNPSISTSPISTAPVPAAPTETPSQPAPLSSTPAARTVLSADTAATSRITSGLKIHGEISGASDIYIDGEIDGKIQVANACVSVGPKGRVQADIAAREIDVEGAVHGNMKAGESAHFGSSSNVVGSVLSPRIGIDDGARFRGKVETIAQIQPRDSSTTAREPESEPLQPVSVDLKGD